jgi:uncharacterized protein
MDRIVRWIPVTDHGAEYLRVTSTADGFLAESVVVGAIGGAAYGLRYRIRCDAGWRLREAGLALVGTGEHVHFRADGEGQWRNASGEPLRDLDGCIDIDISATPFTNTLPIRRLALARGESRDIRVAYIRPPSLKAQAVAQRYTCLDPGVRYRYEGLFRGFTGELAVDADGLVIDYPETFKRVT